MSGYRLLPYYHRTLIRSYIYYIVLSTAAQAVRRHDGIMFSVLAVAARLHREPEKRCAVTLLYQIMLGKIFDMN